MKNKILLTALSLILIISACKKEKESIFRPGTSISVNIDKLTIFDFPANINIGLSNSNVKEIELSGTDTGILDQKIAVSEGKANLNLKMTDLKKGFKANSSLKFKVVALFNDYNAVNYFKINEVSALSIKAPTRIRVTPTKDTSVVRFSSKIYGDKEIESFTFEKKKNNEDFVTITPDGFDKKTKEDLFYEYGINYAVGDTITYKVIAATGNITETKQIKIAIVGN